MLILPRVPRLLSLLIIKAYFLALTSALAGPGTETIDRPQVIPTLTFLQTSDTICELLFRNPIRERYGFGSWLVKATKSFGAQHYGSSRTMATFYCGDGRRTGDLPADEVRTRGPFLMACVADKEIRLTQEPRRLPLDAYRPAQKAICQVPGEEKKRGSEPDPEPEPEPDPEDDEPDTTLRLSSTAIKSGTTGCLQTMSIDTDWLKMSFSVWTAPMDNNERAYI